MSTTYANIFDRCGTRAELLADNQLLPGQSGYCTDTKMVLYRRRVTESVRPSEIDEFSGAGTTWYTGTGIPNITVGNDGDFYLKTDDGTLYLKASGAWVESGNIRGAQGEQGTPGTLWYTGTEAPGAGLGIDGDFYILSTTGEFYEKVAGVWTSQGSLRGAQGLQGNPGENGVDGDSGSIWYNGSGAPSNGLGVDGDYYLDNDVGSIYTKTLGVWGVISTVTPIGLTVEVRTFPLGAITGQGGNFYGTYSHVTAIEVLADVTISVIKGIVSTIATSGTINYAIYDGQLKFIAQTESWQPQNVGLLPLSLPSPILLPRGLYYVFVGGDAVDLKMATLNGIEVSAPMVSLENYEDESAIPDYVGQATGMRMYMALSDNKIAGYGILPTATLYPEGTQWIDPLQTTRTVNTGTWI